MTNKETMRFLRFQDLARTHVAVFAREGMLAYCLGKGTIVFIARQGVADREEVANPTSLSREIAFDRPSLESRLATRKSRGMPHEETERVLANWPEMTPCP